MKRHRFIGHFNLSGETLTISDERLIHQWRSVLRFKPGSHLVLCDGKDNEATAEIVSLKNDCANLKLLDHNKNKNQPKRKVDLYASIIKRDKFEWLAEKAVECGVLSITPIVGEHTVKTKISDHRVQMIMHEAAEQSDGGFVPTLHKTISFSEALIEAHSNKKKLVICEMGPITKGHHFGESEIALFVGPEGGFTDSEIELAKEYGATVFSLGERTLRAETAAIIATHKIAYD